MSKPYYTQEEMQEILKIALQKRSGGAAINIADMLETAKELGISAEELAQAQEEYGEELEERNLRLEWKMQRKKEYYSHLRSYIFVNSFLIFLNFMTSNFHWFYFPLLGWGLGLFFETWATFYPEEKDIEKGVNKLRKKKSGNIFSVGTKKEKSPGKQKHTGFTLSLTDKGIVWKSGDKTIEIQ